MSLGDDREHTRNLLRRGRISATEAMTRNIRSDREAADAVITPEIRQKANQLHAAIGNLDMDEVTQLLRDPDIATFINVPSEPERKTALRLAIYQGNKDAMNTDRGKIPVVSSLMTLLIQHGADNTKILRKGENESLLHRQTHPRLSDDLINALPIVSRFETP
jgi:hypothetical protein